MTAVVIDTYQMLSELRSPIRVLVGMGLGLSFVLTMSFGSHLQDQKHHESHTVNQQRCLTAMPRDIFSSTAQETKGCSSCGGSFDHSAFASKGLGRKSSFCKKCENKKRRSAYKPKSKVHNWDNPIIRFEAAENDTSKVAPLIWEMIVTQGFVDAMTDEEQTLDALLSRKNSIDIFLGEVEYEKSGNHRQGVNG